LALELARAQVRDEAVAVDQVDAEQLDRLALPEAELAAGEVRVVEDGVEAGGVVVGAEQRSYLCRLATVKSSAVGAVN
jgi:hypothetical protein